VSKPTIVSVVWRAAEFRVCNARPQPEPLVVRPAEVLRLAAAAVLVPLGPADAVR